MTREPIWTFVSEYREGTHIAQAAGATVMQAAKAWARAETEIGDVQLSDADRRELEDGLVRGDAVRVRTVENVWGLTTTLRGHFLLTHAILTVRAPQTNALAPAR